MSLLASKEDLKHLVETLNFKEKVERSKELIREAYAKYGNSLAVANSLCNDSVSVLDLTKRRTPKTTDCIVSTR